MLAPGRMEGGATSGFDAEFLMFAVGVTPTPEAVAAVDATVQAVQYALGPWTRGCYVNFAERRKGGETLFGPSYQRLREVKADYDPADLIRSNHPVKPAAPDGH